METIISVVEQNPMYGLIGALLVVFVIVSLLKKLLFVALCAVGILAGFTFYLQSTGQEIPERTEAITERLVDTTKDATRKLGEKVKETTSSVKEKLKDSLADRIRTGAKELTEKTIEKTRTAVDISAEDVREKLREKTVKLGENLNDGVEKLKERASSND